MTTRDVPPADAPDAAVDHDQLVAEICRRTGESSGDVRTIVEAEVRSVAPLLGRVAQQRLAEDAVAALTGLGPLDGLLRDPAVDEVLVNRGSEIWIDRNGRLERAGDLRDHRLEHLVERILAPVGRRVDRTAPIVDARLPDGSRVCAVIEPVAVDGPMLSIRRFAQHVRQLTDFTDPAGARWCREIVAARCNVVVSGPTSSGKTSLLAALVGEVAEHERLVVLEDTTELAVAHPHVVRLEARPATADLPSSVGLDQLVRTAMRLRPDRLIVGEVRGDEAVAMVQAMNTGHDGSLTTCHANSAHDAMLRLESLVLRAAPTWPLAAIREQLQRSVDVVIHVGRDPTDGTRSIRSIAEVAPPASATSGGEARSAVLRQLHPEAPDADTGHGAPLRRRRRERS